MTVDQLREQHQLQQKQKEPQQRQKRRQQRFRREVMKELRVRLEYQFDGATSMKESPASTASPSFAAAQLSATTEEDATSAAP